MTRLSLVLIGRNEAHQVDRLLTTMAGAVDEIVYVDTGSDDDTLKRVKAYDLGKGKPGHPDIVIGEFLWCDDFAAARNYADSLATGDVLVWCDMDDEIVGAHNLRRLADSMGENVALFGRYNYAQDPDGNCMCELWRERLIRRGAARWEGRVHEAYNLTEGPFGRIAPSEVEWVHRRDTAAPTGDRNLRILEAWEADEPGNPRVLGYLGVELAARGRHEDAVAVYRRCLEVQREPGEHRAQTARRLCASLIETGDLVEAQGLALAMVGEIPEWPDSYLTLADIAYRQGRHTHALDHAGQVVRRGKPETLLILNPLDYSAVPKSIMAAAFAGLGRLDEACQTAEQALAEWPGHPTLGPAYQSWRGELKRAQTAATWIASVDLLVQHDEQLKALTLLEETVPHYVEHHPQIVQRRSMLRERVRGLGEAQVDVEQGVPDDQVDAVVSALPRARMLAAGIKEIAA